MTTLGSVLVTGAAGFAGGHLVRRLQASGADVAAWSRRAPPADMADLATWRQIDMLDAGRVRAEIATLRPSAVFHCAGLAHVADSLTDTARPLATNVMATHYLLEATRRSGHRCRVLVPGSATVYAASADPIDESGVLAPASPYALSKLAQEQLARGAYAEDGIDVVVTRSFNHTGPGQTTSYVTASVARQIAMIERGMSEPVLLVGNLDAERDISDVRDVVRAYLLLIEHGNSGSIYNVASGVGRSIRSVLDAMLARTRTPIRVDIDPARLRPNDMPTLVGDATRLRQATGWAPEIPFEQTLDDLLQYWRGQVTTGGGGPEGPPLRTPASGSCS